MTGVLYLRKSRADDPGEPAEITLARHESALRELADREGVSLCGLYREVASGDRLAGRREMQRLLADCEGGGFQAVLCMDIDRLGRGSMAEQGYILDTFKQAGVRLITPRKTYDLNNDLDETYSEFESFIARQELKAIKRRLQRGVQRSVQEGSFVSAPPYGYRRAAIDGHPSLAPDPVEAEAVVLAFHLYTREGLGCQQIADRLSAMGYLPRRGASFSRTTVLAMLANPVYAGRVVRQETNIPGLHPPLVTVEQFAAAAAIRRGRSHSPRTPRPLQNPLAGLVLCGVCGGRLQRLPAGPHRRQESLRCPRTGCSVGVRLSAVEAAVRQVVLSRLPAQVRLTPEPPPPAAPLPARRAQLEEQRQRLYTLLEQGVYTPAEFYSRRAALEQQQAALPPPAESPTPPRTVVVAEAYDHATPAAKNALLKDLFLYILYRKEPGWPPQRFELDIVWR